MKIKAVEHGVDLVGPSEGRSEGLHASDLYGAYYKKADPKRYGGTGGPNPLKLAMGLAWETYLEKRLLASGINAERPGEFVVDCDGQPMAFSPDLYIVNGTDRGGEIKLTWMSESDALDDPKFQKWHSQMMVYGHHMQINQWRMYALFLNGNYKDRRDPVLRAYDIEYSAREMRDEWDTMRWTGKHEGLIK
jgi:hypothetical protein